MKKWLGQSCALLLVVSMLMNGMAQPVLAQNGNERTAQEQAEYSGGGIEGEAEAAPEETPNALRKTETGALGEQASPSKAGKKQADSSDVLPDGRVLNDTASPANAGLNLLSLLARGLTGEKPITYRYEAKNAMGRDIPSAEIPQAILDTCPREESKAVGETVHPKQPVISSDVKTTPCKGRNGTWTFNGWNQQSLTVAEEPEQNVFVGSWTFRDNGFGVSEYLGAYQTVSRERQEQHEYRIGKIILKIKVDRLPNLSLPDPDPFHLPQTYTISARLVDHIKREKKDGRWISSIVFSEGEKNVGTGTFVEESRKQTPSDPNVYTVTGYLKDSYGENVTFPMFDENGVGISYQIQNEDPPFRENGIGSEHHHRWDGTITTPHSSFDRPDSQGRISAKLQFDNSYIEYVSSEFRSTWLTGMPEAERPVMRAQLHFEDEGESDPTVDPPIDPIYVPLLKKNYEDDPENYVRVRMDVVGNNTWVHNFQENEEKHEFGLIDDGSDGYSDLRAPLDVTLEGLDSKGFITKDGHRFKSSITYDPYKGAFATFQEEYQVTFHSEEGKFSDGKTEDKKYPCLHGEKLSEKAVTAVKAPTREGFHFGGWRVGANASGKHFDLGDPVTGNMDLYATWNVNQYKVTFHPEGGTFSGGGTDAKKYSVLKDQTLMVAEVAEVQNPTREGFRFGGWRVGRADSEEHFNPRASITQDMDLYAKWEEKPIVVTTEPKVPGAAGQGEVPDSAYRKLTFDPNEGKFGSGAQPVTYWILKNKSFAEAKAAKDGNGDSILRIPEAGKHYAQWLGWDLDRNNATAAYGKQLGDYEQTAGFAEDVTLYAIYQEKPIVVTTEPKVPGAAGQGEVPDSAYRKLTFDPNEGKFGSGAQPVTYWILKNKSFAEAKAAKDGNGDSILRIPEAAKDDTRWLGWDIDESKTTATHGKQLGGYEQKSGFAEDVTFYAIYEPKPIVVTTEPKVPGAAGQGEVPDPDYRKLTFDPNKGKFGSDAHPVTYWILKSKRFTEAKDVTDGSGNPILRIPEAAKDNADWLGWDTDGSTTTATYNQQLEGYQQDTGFAEDVTFYAIYQAKPIVVRTEPKIPGTNQPDTKHYRKIVFDSNSGIFEGNEQQVSYWSLRSAKFQEVREAKDANNQPILQIPQAKKAGFHWNGWSKTLHDHFDPTLSDYKDPEEDQGIQANMVTFYAIYEPKPTVVTTEPKVPGADGQGEVSDPDYRKLIFDPNGGKFGSGADPVTYWILKNKSVADAKAVLDGGNPVLRIPEAAKDNAEWLGWHTEGSQKTAAYNRQLENYNPTADSTADVTLYAIYKEKSGTDPGTKPGTEPGTEPGTKPGTEPGNDQPGTNEPETKPGHSSSGGGHSSGGGGSIRGRGRKPSQGVTQPREQTPPAPVTPTSAAAPGGAVAPSSPAAPTSAVSPTDSIGSADSNGFRETAAEAPAPEEAAAVPGAPRRLPRTGEHANRLLWTVFFGLVSLSLLVFGMKRKHKRHH